MAQAGPLRSVALAILIGLAIPVTQLKTSMPSIRSSPPATPPASATTRFNGRSAPGATGPLPIITPPARRRWQRRSLRTITASRR